MSSMGIRLTLLTATSALALTLASGAYASDVQIIGAFGSGGADSVCANGTTLRVNDNGDDCTSNDSDIDGMEFNNGATLNLNDNNTNLNVNNGADVEVNNGGDINVNFGGNINL